LSLLTACDSKHDSISAPEQIKNDVTSNILEPDELPKEIFEVRENPYQIGENWDRELVTNKGDYAGQVFQLYRSGMGAVGTGFYLGEFSGKHIVMTAAHVYKDLVSCEDEISFIAKSEDFDFYFYCSGWSFQLKDNDVLFFEIDSRDEGAFDVLKAINFSNGELVKNDPLRLVTINRDIPDFSFSWYIDQSVDCILMDENSKVIVDPDSVVLVDGEDKISSWSLPVGCDGMQGDSGAPVFDENFGLVGLLWTGKHPKTNQVESIVDLAEDVVWSELNYIVPISKVADELSEIAAEQPYLSLYTKRMVESIRDSINGKQ